jgi:hypothetical protein
LLVFATFLIWVGSGSDGNISDCGNKSYRILAVCGPFPLGMRTSPKIKANIYRWFMLRPACQRELFSILSLLLIHVNSTRRFEPLWPFSIEENLLFPTFLRRSVDVWIKERVNISRDLVKTERRESKEQKR